MKRLVFLLTLTLVSLATHATGQEGDIIYIDGTEWVLLGKPIYADSLLAHELDVALPEKHGHSTANWAGYTACWSIRKNKLYLDSINYQLYDGSSPLGRTEYLSSDAMLRVFEKYTDRSGNIVAKWLNDDIRVAKGKMLYYVHDGFERYYDNERIISIKHGEVCGIKDYQNYVIEGFAFDNNYPNGNSPTLSTSHKKITKLSQMFPLHIEQYPELADAKRIIFKIRKACVDSQGHLVECEVKVMTPNDNPRLATEMAEALKAYYPWRVLYINGEYRAYGIEGYYFSYVLDEKK